MKIKDARSWQRKSNLTRMTVFPSANISDSGDKREKKEFYNKCNIMSFFRTFQVWTSCSNSSGGQWVGELTKVVIAFEIKIRDKLNIEHYIVMQSYLHIVKCYLFKVIESNFRETIHFERDFTEEECVFIEFK